MLIKSVDDRSRAVARLESLARTEPVPRRQAVDEAWRALRDEVDGEQKMAALIDAEYSASDSVAVIHDLCLDEGGRVVRIDHLLLHRTLDIHVLATREVAAGVRINELGAFRGWNARTRDFEEMASPLARNERRIVTVENLLRRLLPLRLDGGEWEPVFHTGVVLPPGGRIERPQRFDSGRVITADRLPELVQQDLDRSEARDGFEGDFLDLARRLAAFHSQSPAEADAIQLPPPVKSGPLASPDVPAEWRLLPLAEAADASRRRRLGSTLAVLAAALTILLALAAGGALGPSQRSPSPSPVRSTPPAGAAALRQKSLPEPEPADELPDRPSPRPPVQPRWTSPKAPMPAARGRLENPAAGIDSPPLSDPAPDDPESPPPSTVVRPRVDLNDRALRATDRNGQPIAEIRGNLPRIKEEMHQSGLGVRPADPDRLETPECRPSAVMTNAEIAACRELARRQNRH